jgi:hypothetical protein
VLSFDFTTIGESSGLGYSLLTTLLCSDPIFFKARVEHEAVQVGEQSGYCNEASR